MRKVNIRVKDLTEADVAVIGAELVELRDNFEADLYNASPNTHWTVVEYMRANPDKEINGETVEYVLNQLNSYEEEYPEIEEEEEEEIE